MVGKPPFETSSLRETYAKITRCEYTLPSTLNTAAAYMLNKMLQPDPSKRPTVRQLLEMEFMKTGNFINLFLVYTNLRNLTIVYSFLCVIYVF